MARYYATRHGLVKRALSCLVVFFFTFSMVLVDARAAVVMPDETLGAERVMDAGPSVVDPDTFSVPMDLGFIRHTFKGKSDKVVIHIQDAHCNYAAQKKIASIIKYVNDEYGVDELNLEGGAGTYDLAVFTSIRDGVTRNMVADRFVRDGLVNAAEYFAVNNPEKVTLWGVEDPKLYVDNLKVYRDSLSYKETAEKYIDEIDHILYNLKRRMFPEELLDIDMAYAKYKANEMDFKDYLNYLAAKAREKAINLKEYPDIYLLKQSIDEEGKIDFKKADIERDELAGLLGKKLSKRDLKELLEKTLQFEAKRISYRDYYEFLLEKAKLVNVSLESYPELKKYIVYVSLYDAVDKTRVMAEIDTLESGIKQTLYTDNKQKELDRLSRDLVLTRNILDIKLTRDDYLYYMKNRGDFDVRNYESFIKKEAPRYKITATLDKDVGMLDEFRERIEKFYEYSFKRDDVFLENLRFARPAAGTGPSRPA